jgi:hypothetical protein
VLKDGVLTGGTPTGGTFIAGTPTGGRFTSGALTGGTLIGGTMRGGTVTVGALTFGIATAGAFSDGSIAAPLETASIANIPTTTTESTVASWKWRNTKFLVISNTVYPFLANRHHGCRSHGKGDARFPLGCERPSARPPRACCGRAAAARRPHDGRLHQ